MDEQNDYDFRRCARGMTHDEVLAAESNEPWLHMPADIMYRGEMYKRRVSYTYKFAQEAGRIFCVAAVVQNDFDVQLFYIDLTSGLDERVAKVDPLGDYHSLLAILMQELGCPTVPDSTYENKEWLEQMKNSKNIPCLQDPQSRGLLPPHLWNVERSDEELRALMRSTLWRSPRTITTLLIAPGPLGGALLMIRHHSVAHLHLFSESPGNK